MEKAEAVALEKTTNEILSGKKLVNSPYGFLWIYMPLLQDKMVSVHIYEDALINLKNSGVLTKDELLQEYIENGLWNDTKDKNLEVLPGMIDEVRLRISQTKNVVKEKKLKVWLDNLLNQQVLLLNEKNALLANSAEYLAHTEAASYIMSRCVRDIDNKLLWPTFSDLLSDTNGEKVEYIMALYIQLTQDNPEKTIRSIAKSGGWRVRWHTFKSNSNDLFSRSSQDLSNDQFMLVYWSQIYDSVYECLERPPDEIVLNDEKLDKWLSDESEKRRREVGQRFYSSGATVKGKDLKTKDASEIFKVVEGYFNDDGIWVKYTDDEKWAEIERIRDLNSPAARRIKRKEEEFLRKTPGVFVQEHHMRRDKNSREIMGGSVKIISNKKR